MSRPETHADLPTYKRQNVEIARVSQDVFANYPALGVLFVQAYLEAKNLGLVVDEEGTISRRLSDTELDAALKTDQDTWDTGKKQHETLLREGVWPAYNYAMNDYCRSEGITVPTPAKEDKD